MTTTSPSAALEDRPAPPPDPGAVRRSLDAATGAAFYAAARLRARRAFHPKGHIFKASFVRGATDHGVAELLAPDGTSPRPAAVRLSKGAGVPDPIPDILGLALKLHGDENLPEQDLLLASSLPAPVGRHLLVPARSFTGTFFSTILAYRTPGGLVVLGARPVQGRDGTELRDVLDVRPGLRFELLVAPPLGSWTALGTIELGEPEPPIAGRAIEFDPATTHEDLRPVGPLNRLRAPAYAASRRGRAAAGDR